MTYWKKWLVVFVIHIFPFACIAQCEFYSRCNQPTVPGLTVSLQIKGYEQKTVVSKSNVADYLFRVSDSSYKIVSFIGVLPCPSRNLAYDIVTKTFYGFRIKKEDTFFNGMLPGDFVSFECFIVEKKGNQYRVPGILFEVTE